MRKFLRQLVDQLPVGAAFIADNRIFINHAAEQIVGYLDGELPTLDDWFRVLYPGRSNHIRALYERDRAENFPHPTTAFLTRKDGEERRVEFAAERTPSIKPDPDLVQQDSPAVSEVWILRDVTNSDRLARLLAQTTATARIGGWEVDFRTLKLYWTEETYRIHEVTEAEYAPEINSAIDFYAPESVPVIRAAVERGLQGVPFDLELQLITARGRRIWVRSIGVPELDPDAPPGRAVVRKLYGSFQDITERRQAAEALKRSEERMHRLLISSSDCLAELSLDGRVLFINPRGLELLEISPQTEVVGRSWGSLWPTSVCGEMEKALRGARTGQTTRFQMAGPQRKESPTWWDVQMSPITAPGDAIESVLASARDITAIRQAETERQHLERALQQTAKLESLGVMAGGIAHDFNNLLTGILGNTDLVRYSLPENAPTQEYLAQIERAAERAADLCRQMLAYAGKGRFLVEPINLNAVIVETTRLLQMSVSKKAALTLTLGQNLPALMGDVTQIRQVLMNLVINASESLNDQEGLIAVRTGVRSLAGQQLDCCHTVSARDAGEYLYLEVTDTGCGIAEKARLRIFEPFYTTKFTGRGLGLSAVLGIVRSHQGAIQVQSEIGQGSTFRMFFPIAKPASASEELRCETTLCPVCEWQSSGLALVVDDEPPVRSVASSLLRSFGFSVIEAIDGKDAIRKVASHRDHLRLVLLDLTMPRLDGEQALAEVRQLAPALPVILMSGYNDRELSERFAQAGLAGVLQKPFTRDQLGHRIKAALHE